MLETNRRRFLGWSIFSMLTAIIGARGHSALAANLAADLGPPQPFDFERLRQRAKSLAEQPYAPIQPPAPRRVQAIDFDINQKIAFRPEYTLWPEGPQPFPVRLFHLNKFNDTPARIHIVTGNQARQVLYSPRYFSYGDTGIDKQLPPDLGFAGFRLMNGPGTATDWLAFLGASYFRSAGDEDQYGASARGIAIDSGMSKAEEFPRFSEFWLDPSETDDGTVTIHALLDGESVTGAYRFKAAKQHGAVIDVHAALFFRRSVQRLGLAPLTSMFWYGENGRQGATDWRPEVHDNDGLALWTGTGERVWRPLVNPPSLQTNAFQDENPKGFGLMQRDRNFEHYQDDGAFYERRPGIWIEPTEAWGKGAVMLVEIPTDDEIHDNIVAFWQPAEAPLPGTALTMNYRMHWRGEAPHRDGTIGRVVATRIGHGGAPGLARPDGVRKIVIDFAGGPLDQMERRFDITPVIDVSHGTVVEPFVINIVGTKRWRAFFDLRLDGGAPIDLRCFLRLGDQTLTETWLYQYHPRA